MSGSMFKISVSSIIFDLCNELTRKMKDLKVLSASSSAAKTEKFWRQFMG